MSKGPLLLIGLGVLAVGALVLAESKPAAATPGSTPASSPELTKVPLSQVLSKVAPLPVLQDPFSAGNFHISGKSTTVSGQDVNIANPLDLTNPNFVAPAATWLPAQLAAGHRVFMSAEMTPDANGYSSVEVSLDHRLYSGERTSVYEIVAG